MAGSELAGDKGSAARRAKKVAVDVPPHLSRSSGGGGEVPGFQFTKRIEAGDAIQIAAINDDKRKVVYTCSDQRVD